MGLWNKITIAHLWAKEFDFKMYLDDDDGSVVLWRDDSDSLVRVSGLSPEFRVVISRQSTAEVLSDGSLFERLSMDEFGLKNLFVNLMEAAGQSQDLMRR